MSHPVRLTNRSQFRRPALWGGVLISFGGALLAVAVFLPDVLEALGATLYAQLSSAGLVSAGTLAVAYAFARFPRWIEFAEQVRVRRALSDQFFEWAEVERLELVRTTEAVRPLAPLAGLAGEFGPLVAASGITEPGRFDITTRRLRVRLKSGRVLGCDIRSLEWERVVELAQGRSVGVSAD